MRRKMKIALLIAETRIAPVFSNATTYLFIKDKRVETTTFKQYQFITRDEFDMAMNC